MTMPNFMIIGAAKAGTSALYRYIKQHPDVYMSPKKEPHFFSFDAQSKYTKGPGDTIPLAITDPEAYEALFDGVTSEVAIGEASPTYLYVSGAAERIAAKLPDVKMVAILRQPVDRAYSAFMHVVRDGRESLRDFSVALEAEYQRIAAGWGPIWHYIQGGFYHTQLMRFYDRFSSNQIKVLLYDDFRDNPVGVVRDVFSFIQVDPDFVPDMSAKPNVSGIPKSSLAQKLMYLLFIKRNPIKKIARLTLPESVRWRFTTTVRNRNLRRVPLPPKLRRDLTNRYYKSEIEKLEVLLNRNLRAWKA